MRNKPRDVLDDAVVHFTVAEKKTHRRIYEHLCTDKYRSTRTPDKLFLENESQLSFPKQTPTDAAFDQEIQMKHLRSKVFFRKYRQGKSERKTRERTQNRVEYSTQKEKNNF